MLLILTFNLSDAVTVHFRNSQITLEGCDPTPVGGAIYDTAVSFTLYLDVFDGRLGVTWFVLCNCISFSRLKQCRKAHAKYYQNAYYGIVSLTT